MNQDISPPSYQAPTAPVTPTSPEGAPAAPEVPQQPAPQVIAQQSGPKRGKGKGILLTLLILLLLAAAVGGAYYYQQGKLNTLGTAKMSADRQIVSLQSQLAAAQAKAATATKPATTTTPAVTYNIVTGNVTTQAVGTASISGLYKPGTVDELWLEYGTTPDALKTATVHITQGLTAGDPSTYAQQTFKLTGLTSGQNYFYHLAAKAKGVTTYSGTASFTATK